MVHTQPSLDPLPGAADNAVQPIRSVKNVAEDIAIIPQFDAESIELNGAFEFFVSDRVSENTTSAPETESSMSSLRESTNMAGSASLPPVDSAAKFVRSQEADQLKPASIRPVGQLHDSFVIAIDDEGLLLVDQHVAHERILFDKFRHSESERTIESQNLLLPETLDLTPAQMVAFQTVENDLAALGFAIMRLSGRTIAVKSIPTDLPPADTRNFLAEILDAVDADKRGSAKMTHRDEIAASLACRAAIKVNMKLTEEKMQWLIDRLLVTSSPTTCPHGRPVILRLSMKDIERGFHRT
jgi:DNA mismatch repair protein MutL